MITTILATLAIPFLGTIAGAAWVFLIRGEIDRKMQRTLLGFASGIMVAASVWSLLIPAMETASETAGTAAQVLPAAAGFLLGMGFMLLIDRITPHEHIDHSVEGPRAPSLSRIKRLALAVTIHNIPEGMAVGVTLAAVMEKDPFVGLASTLALAIGIAVQNVPEGAIVSMPLHAAGGSRMKAFLVGAASGLVEPVASVLTILLVAWIVPVLPWLLAFAAGAMLYVVVEELIPESSEGSHTNLPTIGFAIGFALMMTLDTLLG